MTLPRAERELVTIGGPVAEAQAEACCAEKMTVPVVAGSTASEKCC